MKLASEFIRLPLAFDVEQLLAEARQYSEYEWEHHPLRYDGNTALSLVSQHGGNSNSTAGSMQPTQALQRSPYVQQVMASFNAPIGRSRFMRLAPYASVPQHADTEYAWRNRVRIHVPIITDPAIRFVSINASDGAELDVHMAAGEAWIFDNWCEHAVHNHTDVRRIHLVIDTVGSPEFWAMAARGWNPRQALEGWQDSIEQITFEECEGSALLFEQFDNHAVRAPDEIDGICEELLFEISHLQQRAPFTYAEIDSLFAGFRRAWRERWASIENKADDIAHYQTLVSSLKTTLQPKLSNISLKTNRVAAFDVSAKWLDATTYGGPRSDKPSLTTDGPIANYAGATFIVAAPRAGGAMLFEALRANKKLWSIGDVMLDEVESIEIETERPLSLEQRGFHSDRLGADNISPRICQQLLGRITEKLQNSACIAYHDLPIQQRPASVHWLDFSPKNALRIAFFRQLIPNAKFIFLHRDAQSNIASIIEAWQSQRFVSYPSLPGWRGLKWSLPLIDGWRDLGGKSTASIAAHQWASINDALLAQLSVLPSADVCAVSYEELLARPGQTLASLCQFSGIPYGPKMRALESQGLPKSRYSLSEPEPNKWQAHFAELNAVEPIYQNTQRRITEWLASR